MPDAMNTLATKSPLSPIEVTVMTCFGVMTLCGLVGTSLGLSTDNVTGAYELQFIPLFLGFAFASLTSLLMVWLRDRTKAASAWLAAGVLLWFIGVNFMGFGGAMALDPPNDETLLQALDVIMFCLSSGGVLALTGLGVYVFDRQRKGQAAVAQATSSTATNATAQTQTAQPKPIDAKLERATEYRHHIDKIVQQQQTTPFAGQLTPITDKLSQWEAQLQRLVKRIKDFEDDTIIQRDLQEVPKTITQLQEQLAAETNPQIQQDIQEALGSYQAHQRQLDSLATMMRRTELDIDETLAAIGAIYSQLQLLGAKDIDRQRVRRLSADVDEQAQRLEDLLDAMDEVYSE